MAGRDFGGEMRCRSADGTNLTLRAGLTLGPAGISTEPITNQDGSVSRQATPRPRTAEVTLEDGNENYDVLLRAPRQDIYFTEEFTGISHVFVDAHFGGDPRIDRSTGEVTGLVINASGYQRLGS